MNLYSGGPFISQRDRSEQPDGKREQLNDFGRCCCDIEPANCPRKKDNKWETMDVSERPDGGR